MRTLDEVIKAVEEDLECANVSYPESFYDYDNHKDALHYLKEYQETKKHLACLDAAEIRGDDTQVVNNPQLTWDELKTMEGKPVWIELPGKGKWKGWDVIGGFDDDDFGFAMCTVRGDDYYLADLGKTWQAYRKER